MAEDWGVDVRNYVPDADDGHIAGIVRHCGIALRSRDASLVSFTDPSELATVRESFCRRKLGLTETDAELDAAIGRVGERMRADHTKNRVTVYYLLAKEFDKLGLFGSATGAAAAASAAPATEAAATGAGLAAGAASLAAGAAGLAADAISAVPAAAAPVAPVSAAPSEAPAHPEPLLTAPAAPVTMTPAAAFPTATTAAVAASAGVATAAAAGRSDGRAQGGGDAMISTAAIGCGGIAAIILGTAIIGSLAGRPSDRIPEAPAVAAPDTTAAAAPVAAPAPDPAPAAPAAPATPDGAGIVAQDVAGKPAVSVYFDTAKADIAPGFEAAAAPVKAYVDGHTGARVTVSGFNDPRGNAAFNAQLSKNRAKTVAAALTALGVPAGSIDMVKPPETTDTGTTPAQARRVDISVTDAH